MKNKLMRTTALVGSLMLAGSVASVAQTTVSGNLDISWKGVSNKKNPIDSYQGFGRESQINVQNKGSLNNGLNYAAGFSLEFDGNDNGTNGTSGWASENIFIDIIGGNTTLTIGADHMQNPDSHAHVNMAGVGYIGAQGVSSTANAANTAKANSSIYPDNALSQYQAFGVGVTQKTGIGSFSLNYTPSAYWTTNQVGGTSSTATYVTATSNISGAPDIGNNSSIANYEGTGESAYEIGFTGDLGVKGLNVLAFYNKSKNTSLGSGMKDYKGEVLGGNYNFGQFTVGLDWRKQEAATLTTTSTTNTGKSIGLAYAVTPNVTVGAVYAKADLSGDSAVALANIDTEKTRIISIGYNMGPVVVNAQARDTTAVGGSKAVNGDAKDGIIKVSTKF